jgi:hypothetical protein
MPSEPVPCPPGSLVTVLVVIIVIPLFALVVDYMARVNTRIHELVRKAGADLCLLGLGSSGAVFIEPRVSIAFGARTSLIEVIVIFAIFFLRFFCLRIEQQQFFANREYAGLVPGVGSVFIVGAILLYSYWAV